MKRQRVVALVVVLGVLVWAGTASAALSSYVTRRVT